MKKFILVFMGMGLILTSCKEADSAEETVDSAENICFYEYNEGTTQLTWTSFKTTERVGVSGGFNEIEVESEGGENPKEVIESISFKINTASVESNDEGRNQKISEHFFGTINTPTIEGSVVSLGDDGKAIIEINMNGVAQEISGEYTLDGGKFDFKATLEMASWNAVTGIDALNKVCEALHTGADGVSKLWPDVEVSLSTKLKSDCD